MQHLRSLNFLIPGTLAACARVPTELMGAHVKMVNTVKRY
jgi:hypothetical protein